MFGTFRSWARALRNSCAATPMWPWWRMIQPAKYKPRGFSGSSFSMSETIGHALSISSRSKSPWICRVRLSIVVIGRPLNVSVIGRVNQFHHSRPVVTVEKVHAVFPLPLHDYDVRHPRVQTPTLVRLLTVRIHIQLRQLVALLNLCRVLEIPDRQLIAGMVVSQLGCDSCNRVEV